MRTSINRNPIGGYSRTARPRSGLVATGAVLLMLLDEGQDLVRMTRSSGWPARQIHLFASRHGYLFTANGTPYKPPAHGEQPRVQRPAVWSHT
jgi:hypothetical protein